MANPRRHVPHDTLVEEARALGVDPAHLTSDDLRDAVMEARREQWQRENAEAIRLNNEQVERDGLWCDAYRLF